LGHDWVTATETGGVQRPVYLGRTQRNPTFAGTLVFDLCKIKPSRPSFSVVCIRVRVAIDDRLDARAVDLFPTRLRLEPPFQHALARRVKARLSAEISEFCRNEAPQLRIAGGDFFGELDSAVDQQDHVLEIPASVEIVFAARTVGLQLRREQIRG